jgi:tetratricopeptide (TPR) repeat protein
VATHLTSSGGAGRYQFWGAALDAFRSEPVRGIGAGGYESWWAQHGSLAYFVRDAHSLPLEVLAELGALGLVALLLFLGGAVAGGLAARAKEPRAGPVAGAGLALLACATTTAGIEWTWELPAAFALLVVVGAVLCGPAVAGPVAPVTAREPHEPRFGLGVATLGLAWIAVIAATIALVAEVKLSDSRAAARKGDLKAAASDATAARAVAPWSGAPWLQLALVRERRGDLAGARSAAEEAAERDTDDSRVWLVIARVAVRAGDIEAASRALKRARSLNPRSPLFGPARP